MRNPNKRFRPLPLALAAAAALALTACQSGILTDGPDDEGSLPMTPGTPGDAAADDGQPAADVPDNLPGELTDEEVAATPDPAPEVVPDDGRRLKPEQLKSRVRAFADQYRSVMADACDTIKANRTDPKLRQKAHQFKIDGATAMYGIAADPSPQTALLDMLVLVTLQNLLVQSEGKLTFPEDHPLIEEKTKLVRDEAWRLAALVMGEPQRRELMAIIDRWWVDNKGQTDIWYVRISDFAGYGRGTALEGVLSNVQGLPGKFLNAFVPLGTATETLDEATAIAERATWLAPRQLILAQWRAEAVILETLATTEIRDVLASTDELVSAADRAVTVAETLPDKVVSTQDEILRGLAENEETLRNLLTDAQATIERVEALTAETGATIGEGEELVAASERMLETVDQIVNSVDGLVERLASMQTEKLAATADEPPGEPFEVTEYTEAINALNEVLQETNALVTNIEGTTDPQALERRVGAVLGEGTGFVDHVSGQLLRLIIAAGIAIAAAGILIVLAVKLIPPVGRNRARRGDAAAA